MRVRHRIVLASIAVILALAVCIATQRQMNALRDPNAFYDELLYLPNEKLLTHFTCGMDSLIADFLWIKCIKYTAVHFKGDGKFTWLNHMMNMTTRLDPHFTAAYRYGGVFLAALKADDDASIELLRKGMVKNPYAWELPYEIAMTYLLNRGTRPDSPIQAARYLGMAVETGKAPQFVIETAAALQAAHDLAGVERSMWEHTRASGDPLLRDLAARKLVELDLRETCRQLDNAVAMYRERFQRSPERLEDLVARQILQALPVDPAGGRFFIDKAGRVQNTTVLDARVAQWRSKLRLAIDGFQRLRNRLPASLDELAEARIMDALPPHPYEGNTWQYDPATGDVN